MEGHQSASIYDMFPMWKKRGEKRDAGLMNLRDEPNIPNYHFLSPTILFAKRVFNISYLFPNLSKYIHIFFFTFSFSITFWYFNTYLILYFVRKINVRDLRGYNFFVKCKRVRVPCTFLLSGFFFVWLKKKKSSIYLQF